MESRKSVSLNRSSPALLGKYYGFVMNLIDNAGELMLDHKESQKSFTEIGEELESLLIKSLKHAFPNHKFIYEDMAKRGETLKLTEETTWIINPLEGSDNYGHDFPHTCVSIALYVNKEAEIGILFNPELEHKYTARRGRGAYFNDHRMNVSGEQDLTNALITFELGSIKRDKRNAAADLENYLKMSKTVQGMRSLGSIPLNMAMVALGAADASYSMGLHIWDMAAVALIVKEAGGVVLDPSGGEFDLFSRRILVAASKNLAIEAAHLLDQYYPTPRDDAVIKNLPTEPRPSTSNLEFDN